MTEAPLTAKVIVERERGLRSWDREILGHFIEHFHRQIYGGLYDPGNRLSDERGFRRDVIDALKVLGTPVMRWPGGNIVSDYHWYDAVGPNRHPTYNMAWQVPEPNSFGTDEFIAWCREVGCEPYICTNGGNGTAQEMSDWVEYCNGTLDTKNAARRRANGKADPYRVKYWGIGNESYGEWQIGAKTITEWGRYVAEAAKMMRRVDPAIVLSAAALPDLDWTLALLRAAGKYLDLVSIHDYWDPLWPRDEPKGYLDAILESEKPDEAITRTEQVLAVSGFKDKVRITFDEWNLRGWHHPEGNSPAALAARDRNDINATYTMADAIFSAGFLNACLRHSGSVHMANISPTVNARGPLFAHKNGIVKRTSFHVLQMYSDHLRPKLADTFVASAEVRKGDRAVAAVDAVASCEGVGGPTSLMLINRHPSEAVTVSLRLDGANPSGDHEATILDGDSTDAFNDVDAPERVKPHNEVMTISNGKLTLPPHSLTSLRL
jgi:alpha-N-arabinofuranosidase